MTFPTSTRLDNSARIECNPTCVGLALAEKTGTPVPVFREARFFVPLPASCNLSQRFLLSPIAALAAETTREGETPMVKNIFSVTVLAGLLCVSAVGQTDTTRWVGVMQVATGKVVQVHLICGRTIDGKLVRGSESDMVVQV